MYVKSFDNLYIPSDIKLSIKEEISTYFNYKDRYYLNGIQYSKIILFRGETKTGKFQLIKTIAYEYNLKLYILNINNLPLYIIDNLIKKIKKRSLIVIQHIDIIIPEVLKIIIHIIVMQNKIAILTSNPVDINEAGSFENNKSILNNIDSIYNFEYAKRSEIKMVFDQLTPFKKSLFVFDELPLRAAATANTVVAQNKNDFEKFYNLIRKFPLGITTIVQYFLEFPSTYMENVHKLKAQLKYKLELMRDVNKDILTT